MTTTFILNHLISGASQTENDLLAGTAVAFAGETGQVWVSATAAKDDDTLSKYDAKFTLFGRESGTTVVPQDSGFVIGDGALDAHGRVVFYGRVRPGEPLALNITSDSSGNTEVYSVMVKTE